MLEFIVDELLVLNLILKFQSNNTHMMQRFLIPLCKYREKESQENQFLMEAKQILDFSKGHTQYST